MIDIQGVQWLIEDENAHKRINELEKKIEELKTIEKWSSTVKDYGGQIIARRQGNVVNIVGLNIGRDKKIPTNVGDINFAILPERFRPKEDQFYIMRVSGSYMTQYGGLIYPNGNINFWTYVEVDVGCFSLSYIVD